MRINAITGGRYFNAPASLALAPGALGGMVQDPGSVVQGSRNACCRQAIQVHGRVVLGATHRIDGRRKPGISIEYGDAMLREGRE